MSPRRKAVSLAELASGAPEMAIKVSGSVPASRETLDYALELTGGDRSLLRVNRAGEVYILNGPNQPCAHWPLMPETGEDCGAPGRRVGKRS